MLTTALNAMTIFRVEKPVRYLAFIGIRDRALTPIDLRIGTMFTRTAARQQQQVDSTNTVVKSPDRDVANSAASKVSKLTFSPRAAGNDLLAPTWQQLAVRRQRDIT